ncbi:NAD(P)/FAD-dependent oxidoreductase, partial [Nocardia gipuzkoensis]
FQVKRGGVFLWQKDTWLLDWSRLVDAEAWSWQVDRAVFDDLLLRNASDQGAEVIEQATVRRVLFDGARPTAVEWTGPGDTRPRTTDFDFLVDASGRAGVLSRRHFDMRRPHDAFRNIAIWSYWRGARLHSKSPEGAINVISTAEGGWIWHIPLSDGRFSVGYVVSTRQAGAKRAEHGSLADYYHDVIRNSPAMSRLLAGAEQV